MYEDWSDGQVYCIAASILCICSFLTKNVNSPKTNRMFFYGSRKKKEKLKEFILVADPDHIKFLVHKGTY